jgi:ankyrin repeat protein
MNKTALRSLYKLTFLVTLSLASMPGLGQDEKQLQGAASKAANEQELQAGDVAAVLNAGDVNGLKALIALHPRLPEAIITEDGAMVLEYAAVTGNTNTLRVLIDAKAPLNSQDKLKRTALYMAVANERQDAALQLIAAGADTKLGDVDNATPLHLAAKRGFTNVVESLIAHGADISARTVQGTPPLAMAAYGGHLATVQLLCEKSANVNDKNANDVTVLHYAVSGKSPEIVRYLLGKGAKKEARDNEGKSPSYWAKVAGVPEIEAMLPETDRGADVKDSDYYSLVKQVTNNVHVDFRVLRLAYTKTKDYKPYDSDDSTKNAASDALKRTNLVETIRLAESVLAKNYVDLDAHILCKIAYGEMWNSEKYDFHSAVLKGLAGSLYASGDGTTPETAIVVISVREEYFFMDANRLKMIKQCLITANGHAYDKVDVENKKTAEKTVIYFNIDIPYDWLTKNPQKE